MKNQPTWPEQFVKNGYSAFITGKWHNGKESLLRSFPAGGAIFMGGMGDPFKLPLQKHHRGPRPDKTRCQTRPGHAVEEIADSAIGFLEQRPKTSPFLLYVAMEAPTIRGRALPAFHEKVPRRPASAAAGFSAAASLRQRRNDHPRRKASAVAPHSGQHSRAAWRLLCAHHLHDSQIGRILTALEKSGADKETLVVFASDQGLALGSHGLMGKQNLYESGMKVPLIFAGPDIPAGQRRDAMCYLTDAFATVGDLTGVKPPEASEGKALSM